MLFSISHFINNLFHEAIGNPSLLLLVLLSPVHSAKTPLQQRSKVIKLCKNVFSPATIDLMDLKKVISKQNNLLSYILCMQGQLKLIRLEVYATYLSKLMSRETKEKFYLETIKLIQTQLRQLQNREKKVQKQKWQQAEKQNYLRQLNLLVLDAKELIQEIRQLFLKNLDKKLPLFKRDLQNKLQSFAQLRHFMDVEFVNIVTEALNAFAYLVWTKVQPEQLSTIIDTAVKSIEQNMNALTEMKPKIDKGHFSIMRLRYLKKQYKKVWSTAINLLDLLESQELPDEQKCEVSFLKIEYISDQRVDWREERQKQGWQGYIMCMSIHVRNVRYQVYKAQIDKQASKAKKRIIYSKGQLNLNKLLGQLKARQKQLMRQFFPKTVKQQLARLIKLVKIDAQELIEQIKIFMKKPLKKKKNVSKFQKERDAANKQLVRNLRKSLSTYADWKSHIQISWFQAIGVTVDFLRQVIYEIISIQATVKIVISSLQNTYNLLQQLKSKIKECIQLTTMEKFNLTVQAAGILLDIQEYIKYLKQFEEGSPRTN